jgi:hypothetical protein
MFTDELRCNVWNDVRQRDIRAFFDTLASLLGNSSCSGMVQGAGCIETSGGLSVA